MHTRYLFNSYSKDPGPLEKASSKHSQGTVKKSFFLPFHVLPPLILKGKHVLTKIITLVSIPGNHTISPFYTFAYAILSACKTAGNPHLEHLPGNFHVQIALIYKSSTPGHFSLSSLNIFLPLVSTKGHAKYWTLTLGLFVGL